MTTTACAVWYNSRGSTVYELCDDEADAARRAAMLDEADDAPDILGVQFSDGRTTRAAEWTAFKDAQDAQASMWADVLDRPAPAMRVVCAPFTGERVEVLADDPEWLGQ